MSSTERSLPQGWKWTPLDECVSILDGKRVPINSSEREQRVAGKSEQGLIPYYGATGQVGWIDTHIFDEELVLLGEDGAPFLEFGKDKAYLVRGKSWVNNHAHVLRAKEQLTTNSYLLHYLNTFDYHGYVTGTTRLKLNQAQMRRFPVPLAPLPEQHRIVAKIEELFSRLDAGVAALKRVQTALKRYKASVLKAACEGRLVPQDPSDEPADVLLERILAERRTKWEADRRKKGKDFSKAGYDEPPPPELTGLPKLPSTWCWASAEQLTDPIRSITYGVVKLGAETSSGIPTLRSSNVRPLMIESGEIKRISPEISAQYGRTVLEGGEVLITVRGTLGGVAAVSSEYAGFNISREVALLAIGDYELASSIQYLIASPVLQTWLSKRTRGIAYTGINIETLKELPIPIIPRRELGRIRNEIERQLSVIGRLEQCATESLLRAARLRQAILSQAFSGGLVPQDPSDEPAERLLDEIRPGQISTLDERAAMPGQRKARATA